MFRKICSTIMVFFIVGTGPMLAAVAVVYADSAVVLPKGFAFFNLENRYFLPTKHEFDDNGKSVKIGEPFSQDLNSSLFTALPAGASLGTSQVDIERHFNMIRPLIAYGLTDRLTIGAIIPYIWAKNKVHAQVDSSNATIGKSSIGAGFGFPLVPLVGPGSNPFGDATPLNEDDIQGLLGDGIDVNGDGVIDQQGQGLKPLETRESEGLGDIEFGGRYQYFRSEYFRAATTILAIAPTGKMDDRNDLVDIPLGDGNWAIRFQFQQDLLKQQDGLAKNLGFPGVGDFSINTKFEYLYNFSDHRTVRVCTDNIPVCTTTARVRRKVGDIIEAEIQGNVGILTDGLILIGGYTYTHQSKAHFSGKTPGLPYGDLAIDSESVIHEFMAGLTFSAVPMVVKKQFPLPFVANVQYRYRPAGKNVFDTNAIWATLSVYFDARL